VRTEHYPLSTIQDGLSGSSFFALKPKVGRNDVFVLEKTAGIMFPFMFNLTYLFVEISPESLQQELHLAVPSQGVKAYVCSEVHPGFWCGDVAGYADVLRISNEWVELDFSLEGKSKDGRNSFRLGEGVAFKRTVVSKASVNP
jgi:hypothetical protein